MGCDGYDNRRSSEISSFNPRTHMGCDGQTSNKITNGVCFNPRTHMGCDVNERGQPQTNLVSIHAPTWGATCKYLLVHSPTEFQSTHPHGVRLPTPKNVHIVICFNPRTHMGCDATAGITKVCSERFQSTHPHGVRHKTQDYAYDKCKFQSTHPHGVRRIRADTCKICDVVSIHAPTWGATVEELEFLS